jgi:hypothetical protein
MFLGLAEAGLFAGKLFNWGYAQIVWSDIVYLGVTYYVSLWYPRSERAVRVAIFVSAASVAGKLKAQS